MTRQRHQEVLSIRHTVTFNLLVMSAAAWLLIVMNSTAATAGVQLFASKFETSSSYMYGLNPATGAPTVIGNSGTFLPGLDFRQDGTLYGSSNSLSIINVSTGQATLVATLPDLMTSIAFGPSDQLYAINVSGDTLFRLDPITGSALVNVPVTGTVESNGTPFPGEINGIDFAPNGTLYGVGAGLYTINPLTGVATRITPLGFDAGSGLFLDLDYGKDGVLRALTLGDSILETIDTSTGFSSVVGATGFGVNGSGLASVPEPGTVVLLGIGAMSIPLICLRRNRAEHEHSTASRAGSAGESYVA